jgi:putative membrane protein
MFVLKQIGPVLIVGAAALAACSKGDATEYPQAAAAQGDEASPQEPLAVDNSRATSQLSDGQILGILATVDSGEIEQARFAFSQANDPRVKQYAEHMIQQHTDSTQKINALASQNGLTPTASNNSTTQQTKGQKILEGLKSSADASFDATYMQAQIQQHQEVLDMLHAQLLPASRSDAVSAHLKSAHTMVQAHLNEARRIEPLLDVAARTDPAQQHKTMPLPQN